MKTSEIRQRFLDYFAKQGHEVVPSSSLVPGNDPTLLFTNAGMVQFKDLFLGHEHRDYQRATTSQRCVRAGGKHNDLENVGYTARHHTFFEMLGNFSFGDYFKETAIHYAWELLTREFAIPRERLWVTVFEDDEEAESIWVNRIGVSPDRVIRIGARDNFWQMGDTGPCGPCSEIFYDHGPDVAGGPPGTPEEDGDRFVEIWNLVFMQFNRNSQGDLEPLPKPSVDTGMGLERMAAVLQGVHSNYETDLFQTLIRATAQVLGIRELEKKSLRVIADHVRSAAFLITDGVIPSNEGRGYVLRRIIRRAIRHGHQSGFKEAFMHRLVSALVEEMGDAFPELRKNRELVVRVLKQENEHFNGTLEQGLKILGQEIAQMNGTLLSGETVFKLYDTYGFPADLTADVAREKGLKIDSREFERLMEAQRSRARAVKFKATGLDHLPHTPLARQDGLEKTEFTGYGGMQSAGQVMALFEEGEPVSRLEPGHSGVVVLSRSPFYAESGGQTGDQGEIRFSDAVYRVEDTRYLADKVIGHFGQVVSGVIETGHSGQGEVDSRRRLLNANNHSATHLLHASLKSVLGNHVEQRGSLVEPGRLRFDFSHFEPVSREQLSGIERLVNRNVRANHEVRVEVMELDDAKSAGAEALFGEKYDSRVRVVRMGDFSFELCGGTHVSRTGDIGLFKIVSESGVAAGVRRIEAITGELAESHVEGQLGLLEEISRDLKTPTPKISERIQGLMKTQKQQARQIQSLQARLATGGGDGDVVKEVSGIRVVAMRQDGADVKSMRITVDQWRNKLQSGVVLIAGANHGKVTLIAGVSPDLKDRFGAGDLIRQIAPLVDGRGGGKPDLAQGGGSNVKGIDEALQATYQWVKSSADQ